MSSHAQRGIGRGLIHKAPARFSRFCIEVGEPSHASGWLGARDTASRGSRPIYGIRPQQGSTPTLVAVGVEDQRALTELALKTVRVQLGLLLTDARIAPRALGLHEPEWLAVVAL